MSLHNRVKIGRRFQRSIRIDTDVGTAEAIDGFVCPESSANVMLSMAKHVSETGQGAFTWTGPYGSGKSSLVVALSALLNGSKSLQRRASEILGRRVTDQILKGLPPQSKGWRILPVVGRRDRPAAVIGEALEAADFVPRNRRREWTDELLLKAVKEIVDDQPKAFGGLLIFVDEMGKFLEAAAQGGVDVYLFQQLAELSSRSGGRLLFVGILHQAFEEYAHRLSREMREEWSKIHGRFVDLAVNTGGEEQIDLLSRAIESDGAPKRHVGLANSVSGIIRKYRPSASKNLGSIIAKCWPLHPIAACLLGPISRRRFGQNQRSIFAFLNSAEPDGFQEFLGTANESSLYEVPQLWDYLRANLEPSILASPDGHRWALAAEAVARCESVGGEALHVRLLKTIALVDLFKERAGLVPSFDLLKICESLESDRAVQDALADLSKWSLITFRKFTNAYAIFEGSDFDIDAAVETALQEIREIDFGGLRRLAGLQPLLAKRHYHETGALRWFDINLVPLSNLADEARKFRVANGTVGQFLLAIPTEGEREDGAQDICRETAKDNHDGDVVVGLSQRSWGIVDLAKELLALEKVRTERLELQGDAVARREVDARLADLQGQLEAELHRAYDNATWHQKRHHPKRLSNSELNNLASELADNRYPLCPKVHNELLNRIKPSSSAVSAQNTLLKRMLTHEGQPRLGIEGFPAEGGLLVSLLEAPGLYSKGKQGWKFTSPHGEDIHRLLPLWNAAESHLRANAARVVEVAEIYDLWRKPPFGVKDGLMPILAVAFLLSRRESIAFYRQGIFQARFKDLDVDYLVGDPRDVQLRWMDLPDLSRRLLSDMAEVVRDIDGSNSLTHLAPIDVARGLVSIFQNLHPWTKRTIRLSANAIRIRNLFKQANDPNKFLFDDIPAAFGGQINLASDDALRSVIVSVKDGLEELVQAYPTMLRRLKDMLLAELQVPNASSQALKELRERAENVKQLAGDLRLEAFVVRLARFQGSDADLEAIASLAADKPLQNWVDLDLDRTAVEMTDMAQKFVRSEAFARVKGRNDKRHAMAIVVGVGGRPTPMVEEFDVADTDRREIDGLVSQMEAALKSRKQGHRNIVLAALAEVSARFIQATPKRPVLEISKKKGFR
jgi:hypothetical protein